MWLVVFLAVLETVVITTFLRSLLMSIDFLTIPALFASIGLMFVILHFGKKLLNHVNPANSIKTLCTALYKAMKACDIVSGGCTVCTNQPKGTPFVQIYLKRASVHDQNVFNTAVNEMLSPIQNPRYLLIKQTKKGRHIYDVSYACPAIIGKKKEFATIFAEELKKAVANFDVVYTHNENGRRLILKCRKSSYITFNQKLIDKKYKVSHWE